MRSKVTQPKVVYRFSLEEYIPDDHLLRLVDSALDLSFIRGLVRERYSDVRAPSVDPVVIFKMMLLGYLYGLSSERRLAEECRYNLAFKWFLGYDLDELTPDHSIFSKARARYGRPVFERFFAEIVRECRDRGLMNGERIFIDATLLKANASRKSLVTKAAGYSHPDQAPHEYLDRFWEENDDDHDARASLIEASTEAESEPLFWVWRRWHHISSTRSVQFKTRPLCPRLRRRSFAWTRP